MMNAPKILVADDSPTELKIISELFKSEGYNVITANNGEEAINTAEAEHPDLIVLDVIMPKMNGFEVCRKLKTTSKLKEIKVLILTSKSQKSDKFWGMKQGADAFMTKPFNDEALIGKAKSLL